MEYFWKKKDWLAYGLAVLVFTLHLSSVYQYTQITGDESFLYPYKVFKMCISRVAVPFFFILSSSIFFRDFKNGGGCPRTQFEKNSSSKIAGKTINSENNHVDVMNKDAEICLNSDTLLPGNSVGGVFGQPGGGYIKKMQSRFRSLVIPYLSWNTIYLIFSIIATSFLSKYFIEREPMQISFSECLKAIFLFKQNGHFWFIFDLIVFFVLSPIFYMLLKNRALGVVSILAIVIPLVCIIPDTSLPSSVFYLMIGAYLGIHHFQWITSTSKKKTIIGIAGIIICVILLFFINDHVILRFPVLATYSICLLFAIDIFKDKIMCRKIPVFVKHSFWVYALHGIVGSILAKSIFLIFPKSVSFAYPNFVLSLVISLIIIECTALLCKRFLPRVYPLLSGGRD